jgi:hypothetical protein
MPPSLAPRISLNLTLSYVFISFIATVAVAKKQVKMNRHIFILSLLTGLGLAAPVDERSLRGPGLLKRGTSTTSVVTTLAQGIEWLIPIQIANKTFNVQLDTGSADL